MDSGSEVGGWNWGEIVCQLRELVHCNVTHNPCVCADFVDVYRICTRGKHVSNLKKDTPVLVHPQELRAEKCPAYEPDGSETVSQ